MSQVLNVGYACNNRCSFCDQGDLRNQVAQPGADVLAARLSDARAKSDELVISGGEATLREDLPALVVQAVRLGFRHIELQTNGRMFAAPDFARAVHEAGAGRLVVTVAIHGDTAAAHDFHTGVKGSFAQAMRGIVNLRKLAARVWVTTVVTRSNFRAAPALAERTAALGVARHKWSFPVPAGSLAHHFTTVMPRYSLAVPYIVMAAEIGRRAGVAVVIKGAPRCVFPASLRPFVDPAGARPLPALGAESLPVPPRGLGKPCETCAERAACPGPFVEYSKEYGWTEFLPVRSGDTLGAQAVSEAAS